MRSTFNLSVSITPEWSKIDLIREAIGRLTEAALGAEHRDAIAVVGCELLENAVKYGRSDAPAIFLHIEEKERSVLVSVRNEIDAGTPHVGSLRAHVHWLGSFGSAAEAYMAALSRVYEGGDPSPDDGRLGLARVAYEGDVAISFEEILDGWIEVRAVRPLARASSSS